MSEERLRRHLEDLFARGYQPQYNGRPSCPFCGNFVDDEETHTPVCVLRAALASPQPEAPVALQGLTIGPIQHDDPLCRKDGCDCWCQACERHNWRHERTPGEPSAAQPTLPVGAVVASALMAANYGGDSGEDVDRFLAELAKRGYSVVPSQPEAPVALDDRLRMYQTMYASLAAKWAAVLDAADKAEDVQPAEAIAALRRIDPDTLLRAIEAGTDRLDREMVEQGIQPSHERLPRLATLIAAEYARLAAERQP